MEKLTVLQNYLLVYSMGFIGGVFLAFIAKIVQALWTSAQKFF